MLENGSMKMEEMYTVQKLDLVYQIVQIGLIKRMAN